MARVELFRGPLNQLLRGRSGPVVRFQATVRRQVAAAARRTAPRSNKPGKHLADSISESVVPSLGGLVSRISVDVPYAAIVERKTGFLVKAARSLGLRVIENPTSRER